MAKKKKPKPRPASPGPVLAATATAAPPSSSAPATAAPPSTSAAALPIDLPLPLLVVLRGVGQIFFQENALSGALFLLGIAAGAPLIAIGALLGSAIGAATAHLLQFDEAELKGGIFGFNASLVGAASFFFFVPSGISVILMLVGCVAATLVTRFVRVGLPFPTYTAPFIVVTWAVYFAGLAWGAEKAEAAVALVPTIPLSFVGDAVAHGIGQVIFQANFWTAVLFVAGLAVSDREHAGLVVLGSAVGMIVAGYHVDSAMRSLNPETLVESTQFANVQFGLYGYNATLAAVALFLWRRAMIPAILGMLISVPLTEMVPRLGIPALTAPFVLATWIVQAMGWLESKFFTPGELPQ